MNRDALGRSRCPEIPGSKPNPVVSVAVVRCTSNNIRKQERSKMRLRVRVDDKSTILNPTNIWGRCTSACILASRVKVTVASLLAKTDTTQVRKGYLKGAYVARCQAQARNQHKTSTARPHELGLRWCSDTHARGWAVQLGTGANGSSTCRLILRKPRAACWVACTERHGDVTTRPWDASARLHATTCSFERWTGRIEHLAVALYKSPTDTLDRISRSGEWKGMSTAIAT